MIRVAQVENLHKSFGDHKVLTGVSAYFVEHRCTFVAGPSGTGRACW